MKKYKGAVYIGRFQPPHIAHIEAIRFGLKIADRVLVILGSSHSPRTVKNPWTVIERMQMISSSLTQEERERIFIVPQRNFLYNEAAWIAAIQNKVYDKFCGVTPDQIAMIGMIKDVSSYYLTEFPQWKLHVPPLIGMNATDVRNEFFRTAGLEQSWKNLPRAVVDFLHGWIKTDVGQKMIKEYAYIQDYKDKWSKSPFPPTFVTVDAVVIKSGHVLMVKRKIHPGKGLYALPGGFVGQDELIADAVLRELHEETGLRLTHTGIPVSHVFDNPERSLRGRTITHAFCFNLDTGELPKVKGGDDAETAFWMPIAETGINSDQIFEDHENIIHFFVNRY